jgi:two-component system sensor histidine kinase/response regulator
MFNLAGTRRSLPSAFLIRYLFGAVIFVYISMPAQLAPGLLTILAAQLMTAAYVAGVAALHLYHRHRPLGDRLPRFLIALEMPLLAVGIPSDSYAVMPLQIVVLAAILDHGLRHGVRVYVQALAAGLVALAVAFALRAWLVPQGIGGGASWILFFIVSTALSIWLLVADREGVDRELDEARKRMGLAVESAGFGYWTNDFTTQRLIWDDNTHRVMGMAPGTFSGKYEDFFARMGKPEAEALDRIIKAAVRDRKPFDYEYRVTWPDGSKHFLGSRAVVVYDAAGKPLRMVGVTWDNTAQRKDVEALKEAQARLQLAIRAASLGVWSNDLVERRMQWDDNSHRIFGLEPGSFSGRFQDWAKFVHPDDVDRVATTLNRALHKRAPYDIQYRVIWPDGSEHIVGSRAEFMFDESGKKPVRLIGIYWDLTAQHRDREELQKLAERYRLLADELLTAKTGAEAAARAKAEFLANMSHEVRTPMSAILGMNSMLLDTPLTARQRQIADRVRYSAEALLKVINDVLDLSKSDAGKMQVDVAPLDLREVVEGAIELVAERVQGKGLELALLYDHALTTGLRGDAGRLHQVLGNLLSNAVKFTELGEIVIDVRQVDTSEKEVLVRVEVRDTGIGIGEDAARKLFQPFTQVEGASRGKYGGTGLGLSISKRFVELMGGEIGVKSAPGAGSTFWFTARLERDAEAQRPIPRGLAGRRVLVVDDHEPSRRSVAADAVYWGMRVDTVADAHEALSMLDDAAQTTQPYQFVVIDQDMPEMDGIDLVREIRIRPQLGRLHIVLLQLQRSAVEQAAMQGVESVLTKPLRYADLYESLRSLAGIAPEQVAAAPPDAPLSFDDKSWRILVAEDDPLNQEVAVYQFAKLGLQARCVGTGTEVIAALEQEPFDIIFMDCEMPEMDGYQATAEIRRREGEARGVWIVAMTAHALAGYREKCLAAGMDDYMTKPATPESIRTVIERFARKQAERKQAA